MPLISICCLSYNHEPYIRNCLNGFLMQKTTFHFEVLVHDDASTDGTAEIIREYELKYPNVIKPIYQTENQYSKGQRGISLKYNFPRAKGKYIAMCEGDDYWTDPLKLQKQVDFLEKNRDFSITCGGYKISQGDDFRDVIYMPENKTSFEIIQGGLEFGLTSNSGPWLTKTLTVVFRKDLYDVDLINKYTNYRDVHLYYHILKEGRGFYFQEIFGVYNMHDGGIHSLIDEKRKIENSYLAYKELYENNKDDYSRRKLLSFIIAKILSKDYNEKLVHIMEYIKLVQRPSDVVLFLRKLAAKLR